MKFTTSWDDGYESDLRVADMLTRHDATGTFYACPRKQHELTMLNRKEISQIASQHEVGAHTVRHPKLTLVSATEAASEIKDSKAWIEDVTGKPCEMFCYPYGFANKDVQTMVQDAGFIGARGVEQMCFASSNPYALTTSLQITPFPWRARRSKLWHYADPLGPLRVKWRKIRQYNIPLSQCGQWLTFAKALFTYALTSNRPYFHLWGHSHEVDKYHMWNDLEEFLSFVRTHDSVEHVTNSQLVSSGSY